MWKRAVPATMDELVTKYVKGKLPARMALAQRIMAAEEPLDEAECWTRDLGRRWSHRAKAKAVWLLAYQRQAQTDKRAKVRLRKALEEQGRKASDREAEVDRLAGELAEGKRALGEQAREAGRREAEVNRLAGELAEWKRALEERALEEQAREAEVNRLVEELAEWKRALGERALEEQAREAEVNRLTKALAKCRRVSVEQAGKAYATEAEVKQLTGELAEARRDNRILEKDWNRCQELERQRVGLESQCTSLIMEVNGLKGEVGKAERASQNLRGKLHQANAEISTAWARVRVLMESSGQAKELKEKLRAAGKNEALRKLAAQMKRLELGGDLGKHYLEVEHFATLSGLGEEEKKTLVLYTLGPQVLKQIPMELRAAGSDFSLLRKSISKALLAGWEDPFWAQFEVKQRANEPTVLHAVKLWLSYCLTQGAEAINGGRGHWLSPKLSQLQDALAVFDPKGAGNAEAKVWQVITLHFGEGCERPQGTRRQRRRRWRRKRCYYCGDPGHLIRDCEEHRWSQPPALPWY